MCIISNLIVIDQFSFKSVSHFYILTHWHSDHYQGITHSWNSGPIYTSLITKKLLLTKYPQLQENVTVIPLNQWRQVSFQQHRIKLLAIDSNHMAGSIMLLICFRDRYYLHTGDMRFNSKIAENSPQLFHKIDDQNYQSKYQIQQLHLDNTFCDPIFQFPARSKALKLVTQLVKQHNPTRLYLCTDTVGKQQAFILLSRYYKTKIMVNKKRMDYISQMFLNYQNYFTLQEAQTWIEVISKHQKEKRVVGCKGSISVTLTGWTNLQQSHPEGYRSYLVPYSLHSNWKQIELLVSWIRPRKLVPIVRQGTNKWESFSKKINSLNGYMFNLCKVKQRGIQFLRKEYCEDKEDPQN